MTCIRRFFIPGCLLFGLVIAVQAQEAPKLSKGGPNEFRALKFRMIGPAVGGRVARSAGVPGDPLTYYVGTAGGGVWKTSDGGTSWKPLFDEQPIATIGSLAVAASDPNVIYVGSGEANIRGNVQPGNGIYKSTDAGEHWQHVWKQLGQIGTMVVHPTNPDVAYAAVLGHAFGPNPERGVYRTTDGGKNWQRILFKDENTGASDFAMDPTNPRILFAGLWQTRRQPWTFTSGGPGSGLYRSRDGGDTWEQLMNDETPGSMKAGRGLPSGTWGKIGIAVAHSDPKRVYALIEAEEGGLYRSDDGGDSWSRANGGHYLTQRAWYYSTLTVDPSNADVIWFPQVPLLRSIDGGHTVKQVKGPHHGDHHDIWIDPKNPRRMIDSNDGGVDITLDGGKTWYAPPLPIAQFYHIAVDNDTPYHVSGAMQDLGTAEGPSNSLSAGGISNGDWHDVGGGEAGFTAHDPTNPDIVYAGEYGGYITQYNRRTGQARNVSIYPVNPSGHGGEDLKYRFQWTAPIMVSPHDAKTIYHAANVLFRSTDGGNRWTAISPDLTRNDKSKQHWSGGPITGDNTGVEIYDTVFAIAESPRQQGLLWAGTDDGRVWLTRDAGKNWEEATANVPGLPEWGTVVCIEPSPFDAAAAYLVVDDHRQDDMKPYLWKTTDYGKSWTSLAGGLPQGIFLHALREDPKRRGLLYLGTERGIAYSPDDGNQWIQLKLNFPTVSVHDLIVKNDDLVIATHGRSVWIFDDLTPIRNWSPEIAESAGHLFPTEPATRWRYGTPFHGKAIGQNPTAGAILDYYLKHKPEQPMTLEVRDTQGGLVQTIKNKPEKRKHASGPQLRKIEGETQQVRPKPPAAKEEEEDSDDDPDGPEERYKKPVLTEFSGVNRIAWDLRYAGVDKIKKAKVDMGSIEVGPLALPGTYSLKLTADGKSYTGSLVVQPDPRVHISAEDLQAQLQFALQLRDHLNQIAHMVNDIRSIRQQIQSRDGLLEGKSHAEEIRKPGEALLAKLDTFENKLHNPKAEVTYDILAQKGGAKLYSQLGSLFEWIKEADGPPTQGMRTVYTDLSRELHKYQEEFQELIRGDLARLNARAKQLAVPDIIVKDRNEPSPKAGE
jgi:photosystem II stability/assembly factor-like uncharacterized protein